MTIMKITEFEMRISKKMKYQNSKCESLKKTNHRIPFEIHENRGNLKMPRKNHKNHENLRISYLNYENHESLRIPKRESRKS